MSTQQKAGAGALAVLKDARTFVTHGHCQIVAPSGTVENYDAAIAAVAELIEADKEYDEARRWWDQGCYTGWEGVSEETRKSTAERFEAALCRRVAALARVGGAA